VINLLIAIYPPTAPYPPLVIYLVGDIYQIVTYPGDKIYLGNEGGKSRK
jgi:hypothetical protein